MTIEADLQEGIRQHAASRELWQQQSTAHEQARSNLISSVNSAINELRTGILSDGSKKTFIGIFGGVLQHHSGTVGGSDDFRSVVREANAVGEAYLHLDTGIQKNAETNIMCLYNIRGYNYGSNVINSETIAAYLYYTGVYHQTATNNGMFPFFYVASNNRFYLRLKLISQYFNQIIIDAVSPNSTKLGFVGGIITPVSREAI